MIKLSHNSKMKKLADMLHLKHSEVASIDLVCGVTCPMADKCKSIADRKTGKITDGVNTKFRCYGATLEGAFPSVRALHWNNFEVLKTAKTTDNMVNAILPAITEKIKVLRIHSFGDFFNENYFNAWVKIAEKLPQVSFFAYTKVLPLMKKARPDNFSMVYSFGGKMDNMLTDEPTAYVVNSIADADRLGLFPACQNNPADDYNMVLAQKSFALVIHGVQPKGTKAPELSPAVVQYAEL
jgi:hypothetical protein